MLLSDYNIKKATLIVHNLASNPIVRAIPFANYLKNLGYEVKIIGFSIGTKNIYKPFQNSKFKITNIKIDIGLLSFLKNFKRLYNEIGDPMLIYCFKPLMTTFLLGLIKKIRSKSTLFLDIEDFELYTVKEDSTFINRYLRGWNKPNHIRNLKILNYFTKYADRITVSSKFLQEFYGGLIIRHGPDEKIFNPLNFDKDDCKKFFNLPLNKVLILFAGYPHVHKGLNDLKDILLSLNNNCLLVLAGPDVNNRFSLIKKVLKNKCIYIGEIDNSLMPKLLTAVDIIPILQKPSLYTKAQLPAKLIEAMAMGKVIISNDVGDSKFLLSENRGALIKKNFSTIQKVDIFKDLIKNIESNKKVYGTNSRKYFIEECSIRSNSFKLKKIL